MAKNQFEGSWKIAQWVPDPNAPDNLKNLFTDSTSVTIQPMTFDVVSWGDAAGGEHQPKFLAPPPDTDHSPAFRLRMGTSVYKMILTRHGNQLIGEVYDQDQEGPAGTFTASANSGEEDTGGA